MPRALQLSVVLPTYNERANIEPLIVRLCAALKDITHEVIVVDDQSPDGTAAVAHETARRYPQVRVIEREPPAGLRASIQEGVEHADGIHVAWLDADLSHPPELITRLLAELLQNRADIACASRYVPDGRDARSSRAVRWASLVITKLAQWAIDGRVRDYTTGYVVSSRALLLDIGFRGSYGEYCIDLLATAVRRGHRVREIPYSFIDRQEGESKTAPTWGVFVRRGWRYLTTIGWLSAGRRPRE